MPRISRRQFYQFAAFTLAPLRLNHFNFQRQGDRYGKVLAQSTPRKLALLAGINKYRSKSLELAGCLSDVELQRQLLVHRFGFNLKDIYTLPDEQATRQGILGMYQRYGVSRMQESMSVLMSPVMTTHERDLIQNQPFLMLLRQVSLPGIVRRSLAVFTSVLLCSESVAAGPRSMGVRISQQPVANAQDANPAAARRFQEGVQLYKQGTAESLRQAIAKFQEALLLYRAAGDHKGEVVILDDIGGVYDALGEKQKALEFYNQALSLSRAVGDRNGEALTLNNIGFVYYALGEQQKALEYFNQSLPLSRAAGNRKGEAVILDNIGRVYSALGEKQKALEYFNQSLPLSRAVGDREVEAVILDNIGRVYSALGEKQKALEYFNRSLLLSRVVGNRKSEAATLDDIGGVYDDLGEKQKALEFYNQSLLLSRAVGDHAGEATTLDDIGQVYSDLGEKQKALEFYNQALSLSRAVGNRNGEATTLNNIGQVYDDLGEKQKALEFYNQALSLSRAVGNRNGEATTLNNIGAVYSALGERQKALEYFNQSLLSSRMVGDRALEATTLGDIGAVYSALGEKQKALEYFNQSLLLRRTVGARAGEATTLNNIGLVYSDLGEQQKALEFYNQSLPLFRAVGARAGEATTINNIGQVYSDLGEQQKALDVYNQSLLLSRMVGAREGEAATLNNIGQVYDDLGEKQKALEFYNQALSLSRAVGNRNGEATTLNNIGLVYSDLGEKQKALEFYNQALSLSRAVGDRALEATTLSNIGGVYSALGEKQKALEYFNQSLPLSRIVGNRASKAATLNNIGLVYSDLGEKQKALEYFNQSLPLSRIVGNRALEATTLYNVADLERSQGNLNVALTQVDIAIQIIEDLRTKIVSQQLRASYFASVQGYYKFKIDLLMQLHKTNPHQGYDDLALQASESAKARSLRDLLQTAHVDIKQGVDAQLLRQERTLQQQLDATEARRIKLLSSSSYTDALSEVNQELETLLAQYQDVRTKIRAANPAYAKLTQPEANPPLSLTQIQQQLDDHTLLLEYSLGNEHSYLWVVSKPNPSNPTGLTNYTLPKRSELETATKHFYQAVSQAGKDPQEQAQAGTALSQLILAPVAKQLGTQRLLIVSDGALQYVPFAALPVPGNALSGSAAPLIVSHELLTLPSISTLIALRQETAGRKPAPKTVVVLADPVFSPNDERIKQVAIVPVKRPKNEQFGSPEYEARLGLRAVLDGGSEVNLVRLDKTEDEAKAILHLVPNNAEREYLGFAANLTATTSPELSQYQIVHFATHGILNSQKPELSGLVFSLFDAQGNPQNGLLRLYEVYNLRLNAELVVLSACKTGLGQEIQGEGLVGLTRGFMYAGAKRVMASLWSVNDVSTAELMERFYQGMLQREKLTPAKALQQAQVQMWKEGQSPFKWAAFTLQGEW